MNKVQTSSFTKAKEYAFNILLYILVAIVCASVFLYLSGLWDDSSDPSSSTGGFSFAIHRIPEKILPADNDVSRAWNHDCRTWNCVNPYRCGQNGRDHLTVYVYPIQDYIDETSGKLISPLTREYYQILKAVVQSTYYTSNPNEACIFLPSIDLLNQQSLEKGTVNRALASLRYWDEGKNHILFTMMAGAVYLGTDKAIIAGGDFDSFSYRKGFDVSIPVWSPALQYLDLSKLETPLIRPHKIIGAQLNISPEHFRVLHTIAQDNPSDLLLLEKCSLFPNDKREEYRCNSLAADLYYDYPAVLKNSTFCLLLRDGMSSNTAFIEMLAYNCIPVVAIDNYILPFEDIIDWSMALVRIRETEVHNLLTRLKDISSAKILEMQQQIQGLFLEYFKDLPTITLSTLKILENRIFPHRSATLKNWHKNDLHGPVTSNPLFLPIIPPKTQGFTAVILTYDRVESLFTLIQKLSVVPSLESILVIWNNQRKPPPHPSAYPAITKPLKVIQTRANKLSNRFYPYAEITTEAILTIDDDIVMLTADELDFGFEVWREFPDRIVGFPSRFHVWNNSTMRWQYESEWTNQISMVLTGAAFHHKYWSHLYTYAMPGNIKEWVDEHMNCEDIAMNFLVANVTKKPPIKVTPRKKFKCPECINIEMLSSDLNHMRERSACIDSFAHIYKHMPLRTVEFRADPVLFKDNFPSKLKRFNDIGTL